MAFIAYFFGGMFLANSIPHLVSGMQGRPFQSPFAKPPGRGLSSSIVNVAWGLFNIVIAYLLLVQVGEYDLHDWSHVISTFLGAAAIAFQLAWHFGKLHGGLKP